MSFFNMFNKKCESPAKDEQFKEAYILALVHRLRTPLNGVRWALDSIIGDPNTDESVKILHDSQDKIIDAINMVSEILKVAEINLKQGPFNLNKERVDLCEIVDGILKNLDFLIKEKEITLEYNDKCAPVFIFADRRILDIGLTNLFDNAFRYSPKGKVVVNISSKENTVKLLIKDNGIGIDKDDFKHIYEKFFRGKNAKIIDPNQSGVGLYATKKIIEIHGGTIFLDSDTEKGTSVEVNLPVD